MSVKDETLLDRTKLEITCNTLDLIWGIEEISLLIGRSPRQTHHILAAGLIAPAKKIGGRWVVSRSALEKFFGEIVQ
jgi:hypothetical protein